jgi:hypothetical protein
MLNSLCKCLYFWADKEEEIDYSVLSKLDQAVSLDVTRAGKIFNKESYNNNKLKQTNMRI